jgi:polyketide synthase PksJ
MPNAQIYILDKFLNPVPTNVIGEICIGGRGVSIGYLNQNELTEQKFIKNPFNKKMKLYKSGDLGRYLHDGSIEYLGRIDYQVKINGFRIELGEIEAQIFSTNIIEEVIVVPFGPINNQRLAAYIVLKNKRLPLNEKDQDSITQDIVNQIKQFLPKFMLPSSFMFLSEFKRNENGKINRNLLPEPNYFYIEKSFNRIVIPPKNDVEIKVVKILSKLLNIKFEDISLTDNIFNLGINSMLLIEFIFEIRKLFKDVMLSARLIYENSRVDFLSNSISCNVNNVLLG